jgi:hypothetical protein
LKKKKEKDPTSPEKEIYAEEWEIGKGMGIIPDDIPFTQNIGCVGGKTKTSKSKNPTPTNEDGAS